jgi:DNA-binding PadR family transcriptional regulator
MFTKTELIILELLDQDHKWWYGLDLVSKSNKRLDRGTIYVHLAILENQGFVESREENDDEFQPHHPDQLRRRLYRITEEGMRAEQKLIYFPLVPLPAC